MILSFSEPLMLPYVRAGIKQALGEDVGDERVKRQTIRKRGPRADRVLEYARRSGGAIPYALHLWWKSRTASREHLGTIPCKNHNRAYAIEILHSLVENPDGSTYPILRIDGPEDWRDGDETIFWSEDENEQAFVSEALADGFESVEKFRDYFVPNLGDRFDGILFKW